MDLFHSWAVFCSGCEYSIGHGERFQRGETYDFGRSRLRYNVSIFLSACHGKTNMGGSNKQRGTIARPLHCLQLQSCATVLRVRYHIRKLPTYHFDCVLVTPGGVDGVSRAVYNNFLRLAEAEIDCVSRQAATGPRSALGSERAALFVGQPGQRRSWSQNTTPRAIAAASSLTSTTFSKCLQPAVDGRNCATKHAPWSNKSVPCTTLCGVSGLHECMLKRDDRQTPCSIHTRSLPPHRIYLQSRRKRS